MKISEQRDSAGASTMRAQGITKQRKKKDAAAPVAKKKMALPSLSTCVLFDSLESYDQVLSCASKGKLHFCSVPDLHCDYIAKNFSVLTGVLFQTRFSSLKTGDAVITAVVLEDSEVVQDLAALQWLDGASKGPVLSSPEEGTSLQPDCVSKMNLDSLPDYLVESAAALSSLKTFQPTHISSHPARDADDCYRPDMSMIVMLESIQARSCPSMCSPDQRGVLCSQEEIQIMNDPEGGLLTRPSMPVFCPEEQPPQPLPPLSSHDNIGSASQEEQIAQRSHTSLANIEISDARAKLESEEEHIIEKFPPFFCQTLESIPFINGGVRTIPDQNHGTLPLQAKNHIIFEPTQRDCEEVYLSDSDHSNIASQGIRQAEVKSESEEEFDLVAKYAMEAVELNVLHGLFEEDDLSGIELLDETASAEESMRVIANVHDFVELEEDQSSNSCQILEVQVNSPVYVVPSLQQTSSAEGNSEGFLLLAQVSSGHSDALTNCSLEEDDLLDIGLLDETASAEGSMRVMANVHDFVELEEDQSSSSCQIQEVQVNSPLYVVPSPQQTEGNSVGMLAQVSSRHSDALKYSNCNLEEQHAMLNTEARSCAKRLFMENEAEGSVEGEAAGLPGRKIKKLDHSAALEA